MRTNNTLVVIPSYNEIQTLPSLLRDIVALKYFDVLVVDDNSPDGTASVVREISESEESVFLHSRDKKLGLGTAYIMGFKWGLDKGYDFIIEMDADGSHNPGALPWFMKEVEKGCGLVIGSRYLGGNISVVGWDFRRLLLSKFGNLYASRILNLDLTDVTSGFRCYSSRALRKINLDSIRSTGYSFQIEMAFFVASAGLEIREMPIIFYERNSGSSKMSKSIVREAALLPWKLRLHRLLKT